MELISVRTTPGASGRVRVVGEIAYDDRPGRIEECWFDFPEQYSDSLCLSGSPWLACMLPLATTLGEPLRIALPVDRLLYRNAYELVAIWRSWFPRLRGVEVIAERVDETPAGRKTGVFFSGGVDAFFTLLRNEGPFPEALPVDELICVGGFDIPLKNLEAFGRLRATMEGVAGRLGKRLIDVVTNLRETRLEDAGWYDLLHGPGAIATGLMLGGRYDRLLIASASGYSFPEHAGTNPLTDPLLSTSRTRVLHDGARFTRQEKTEFLGSSDLAMGALHVCWNNGADDNCGACEKCVRTMVGLELAGRLQNCKTFPRTPVPALISRLFLSRSAQDHFWKTTAAMALTRGRPDLSRAIGACVRRSRVFRPIVNFARRLRSRRFLWRFARPIKRRVLKGAIQ